MGEEMKFEVGQRVAVYENGKRIICRVFATEPELKVTPTDLPLLPFGHGCGSFPVHPKQCRLLKKKKRKRIWIHMDAYFKASAMSRDIIGFSIEELHDTDTEFIEVKK